ncbi:tyrosine-type recombinase/integrase [Geothrix mesophila]|uniref:tyrosine-type recombinase/integrase n=1 Tax=Geothrix mesophila TaxID=2922723 RepID=UPI001FAC697B|nr:site-specific integrase [Geothrix sp. SG198]
MARTMRSPKLDRREARRKLAAQHEPHWVSIAPNQALGYFKPEGGASGTWRARIYLPETRAKQKKALGTADDHADADGRTILNYAQAQAKAREWFAQAMAEAAGERVHRGPFTVAHAMEAYLDHMDQEGKKSAADARKRTEHHILPALGGVEVEKLTRLRLDKWKNELAASPRLIKQRKRPLPAKPRKPQKYLKPAPKTPKTADEKRARKATANRVLSTLKAALTYAKSRGLVHCPDDAWRSVRPFQAVDEARQSYLTPEEQQRLLNSIREPDFKRLVTGALLTGCRYGELTRMVVGDFDSLGGTVLVREAKGGKPRRAMLTEEGKEYFRSLTAGRKPVETLFQRDQVERRTRAGGVDPLAWGPAEQTRRMHDACEAASLPKMGFHQLRHSYASALVAAGMPLAYVAQLTGHADTRMLEKHYAHLAPSDLTRALETLAPKFGLAVAPVAELKIKRG